LNDEGYTIYLSGSNSKLLSKEVATCLRGRVYSVEVFPLSFKEFLHFKGIKLKKHWKDTKQRFVIKSLFLEYMNLSGYPEIVLEKNLSFINDYYKSIFFNDAVERYGIKNTTLFSFLMKYICKN
jgi:predicted AAA+ superfamily ATPase